MNWNVNWLDKSGLNITMVRVLRERKDVGRVGLGKKASAIEVEFEFEFEFEFALEFGFQFQFQFRFQFGTAL